MNLFAEIQKKKEALDINGLLWEVDDSSEDRQRFYVHPDGRRFVGVTTFLDAVQPPKLVNWYKKTSAKKIEQRSSSSAALGSELHRLMERDLDGQSVELTSLTKPAFEKWKELRTQNKLTAIHQERVVYSEKYGFAGTADIIGHFNDKLCVMDKKTGYYGVKASWQMAAYKIAYEEMTNQKDVGLVGLNIKQDGSSQTAFVVEHLDWCSLMAMSALCCWKGLNFYKLQNMKWPWLFTHPLKGE